MFSECKYGLDYLLISVLHNGENNMKNKKYLVSGLALSALLILVIAVKNIFVVPKSSELAQNPSATLLSRIEKDAEVKKIISESTAIKGASISWDDFLKMAEESKEQEYIAVINNSCFNTALDSKGKVFLEAIRDLYKNNEVQFGKIQFLKSKISSNFRPSNLAIEAYPFRLQDEKMLAFLWKEIIHLPCLAGIYPNSEIKVSSLEDPVYPYQVESYLKEINYPQFLDFVESARASGKNGNKKIKVAVLDTGIDYRHPDLKSIMAVDLGRSFVGTSTPLDDNRHGTGVAGIIAGSANGLGVVGIANKNIELLAVKVLNYAGHGSNEQIFNGMIWAAQSGAKVLNLSIGGYSCSSIGLYENAAKFVRASGAITIVAAGNEDAFVSCHVPARVGSMLGFITVAATNRSQNIASFSNYHNSIVEIAAPGVQIPLLPLGYALQPNAFYRADGTSFSSPIVAGAAAAIIEYYENVLNKKINPEEVERIILSNASSLPQLVKFVKSGAFLNMEKIAAMLLRSAPDLKIPPKIVKSSSDIFGIDGAAVTLFVEAFSSSGGKKFQWYKNSLPIPEATDEEYRFVLDSKSEGVYTVVVSNEYGKETSGAIKVLVNNEYKVKLVGETVLGKRLGENVDLKMELIKNEKANKTDAEEKKLAYQWYFNDAKIADANELEYSFRMDEGSEGEYYCVISTKDFNFKAPSYYVKELSLPKITVDLNSIKVKIDHPAVFEVFVRANSSPLSYQWFFNGKMLAGENSSKLSIPKMARENVGQYWVTIKNEEGSVDSKKVSLDILIAPKVQLKLQKMNKEVSKISAMTTDSIPAPLFSWYINGEEIKGQTSAEIIHRRNCLQIKPYKIQVKAYNEAGESLSDPLLFDHKCSFSEYDLAQVEFEKIRDELQKFYYQSTIDNIKLEIQFGVLDLNNLKVLLPNFGSETLSLTRKMQTENYFSGPFAVVDAYQKMKNNGFCDDYCVSYVSALLNSRIDSSEDLELFVQIGMFFNDTFSLGSDTNNLLESSLLIWEKVKTGQIDLEIYKEIALDLKGKLYFSYLWGTALKISEDIKGNKYSIDDFKKLKTIFPEYDSESVITAIENLDELVKADIDLDDYLKAFNVFKHVFYYSTPFSLAKDFSLWLQENRRNTQASLQILTELKTKAFLSFDSSFAFIKKYSERFYFQLFAGIPSSYHNAIFSDIELLLDKNCLMTENDIPLFVEIYTFLKVDSTYATFEKSIFVFKNEKNKQGYFSALKALVSLLRQRKITFDLNELNEIVQSVLAKEISLETYFSLYDLMRGDYYSKERALEASKKVNNSSEKKSSFTFFYGVLSSVGTELRYNTALELIEKNKKDFNPLYFAKFIEVFSSSYLWGSNFVEASTEAALLVGSNESYFQTYLQIHSLLLGQVGYETVKYSTELMNQIKANALEMNTFVSVFKILSPEYYYTRRFEQSLRISHAIKLNEITMTAFTNSYSKTKNIMKTLAELNIQD